MANAVYTSEAGQEYTQGDYLTIARGNERLARTLLTLSDWQHAETILLELIEEGAVTDTPDGFILNY